jgi:hypothetical protein
MEADDDRFLQAFLPLALFAATGEYFKRGRTKADLDLFRQGVESLNKTYGITDATKVACASFLTTEEAFHARACEEIREPDRSGVLLRGRAI